MAETMVTFHKLRELRCQEPGTNSVLGFKTDSVPEFKTGIVPDFRTNSVLGFVELQESERIQY